MATNEDTTDRKELLNAAITPESIERHQKAAKELMALSDMLVMLSEHDAPLDGTLPTLAGMICDRAQIVTDGQNEQAD